MWKIFEALFFKLQYQGLRFAAGGQKSVSICAKCQVHSQIYFIVATQSKTLTREVVLQSDCHLYDTYHSRFKLPNWCTVLKLSMLEVLQLIQIPTSSILWEGRHALLLGAGILILLSLSPLTVVFCYQGAPCQLFCAPCGHDILDISWFVSLFDAFCKS